MQEILDKLIKLVYTNNGSYMKCREEKALSNLNKDEIFKLNNIYKNAKSLREKIYLYKHNFKDVPKCKECGKYLNFTGIGYPKFCSVKCSRNNKETQNKYNNGQHPFYLSAIKTWTICDVNKRNTAINNNLNYIEIWNIDDLYKFINKI